MNEPLLNDQANSDQARRAVNQLLMTPQERSAAELEFGEAYRAAVADRRDAKNGKREPTLEVLARLATAASVGACI